MKISFKILGLSMLPLLFSCTTDLKYYEKQTPAFQMDQFFSGELCAKGLVRNRDKTVNRKFVATIDAESSADLVVLDESFIFDDGEKQKRLWTFTRNNDLWLGSAGDVVGDAIGKTAGNTLHLTYRLKIKLEDDEEIVVNMDDWLHLVDENTLMGSTEISKWGFDVGQIDIFIQKAACNLQSQSSIANRQSPIANNL